MKKLLGIVTSTVWLSVLSVHTAFAQPWADADRYARDLAQGRNRISTFSDIFNFILNSINDVIVLLVALGVVWTMYYAFVLVKVDGEGKDEARNSIIYGLVGIFVMVSVWGLVNIFINTFDVKAGNDNRPSAPTILRR